MVDQIWNYLSHQLATNQFFSGAALTGLLASVAYQLKSVPLLIWARLQRYMMFNVFVVEDEYLASALDEYMAAKHANLLRNVEVRTSWSEGYALAHDNDYVRIWYKRRRLTISKHREKLENASYSSNRYTRSYNISGLLAKGAIKIFMSEVLAFKKAEDERRVLETKKIKAYSIEGNDWSYGITINPKAFSKIHLQGKEDIVKDLDQFKANKEKYESLGIPVKRGYLFYGTPGNGKSTIAAAIADYMKYNIYSLDISDMNSNGFKKAFRNIPSNSVVVLEDIDAIGTSRKKETKEKGPKDGNVVSLSVLLNALSGINQKQNIITVITTNHIEQLDAALTREGRCDFKMEIVNPSKAIAEEYLTNVFEETITLNNYTERPFVELQEIVIRNMRNRNECIQVVEGDMG